MKKIYLAIILILACIIQLYLLYDIFQIISDRTIIIYVLEGLCLGYLACFTNYKAKELFIEHNEGEKE